MPALSLAGIPPFSGFWGKLLVIDASLQAEQYALAAIALLVGLLTLYSMMKIWLKAFWRPEPPPTGRVPEPALPRGRLATMMVPIAILAGLQMTLDILTDTFVKVAAQATAQLPAQHASNAPDQWAGTH